ncbi:putative DNA polymerase [Frankliniella fusca]|uniref:DNA-directed DNA polymerase n=1 Tax=Frankliniella fusca TaxID=407009 RepID=A0AAE1LHB8_9NEOP|nr:putative DNA polymerase [Frankliniella fusca]
MESLIKEILLEWEMGAFYTDEYLAMAYTEMLLALLKASDEDRRDPRLIPFLLAGYLAYRRQHRDDRQALLTYRMALAMVGGSVDELPLTPPQEEPQPGPSRPPSPQPGPSRPPSPQPGPSKRRREEVELKPTLEVLQTRERHLRRFNTVFREEVMQISGLGDGLPSEEVMVGLFDSALQRQRDAVGAKDDDRVILEIENAENADNPLWLSLRRADQLSGQVLLDKLGRILNSNQAFMAHGQFKLSYIHIPTPEAGGRNKNNVANETTEAWLKRKLDAKQIFAPENEEDHMCLARSVAVVKARGKMSKYAYYRMKNPKSGVQRGEALKLCELAGIDPQQPCGIDEVQKLQAVLPDYRLCIFSDKEGKECVFKGPYGAGRTNICLLHYQGHFYGILFPCQAFGYHFMCEKCITFFHQKGEHRCEGSCWRCFGPGLHDDPLRRCADCGHQFAGDECFSNHKTLKLARSDVTKCQKFRFCFKCERSYSLMRGREHKCHTVYCSYCKKMVDENDHLCYMQRWTEREKKDKWTYVTIYYDIETTQCKPVEGKPDTFEHKPNLLVSQAVCDKCVNVAQNDHFCAACKTRQHVFHNLDDPNVCVMGQFFDYLQSFPAKTEILLVAHNAKAFDAVFALQEVIERKLKNELILQGAKILCMKVGNWKFIDSLMFLPMPLSAMPRSFGLHELKKGYMPFLANKPEFYTYEGPMLDKEFYCFSDMKSKAATDFSKWYEEMVASGYVFNFRRELIEYCISDVTILRQACTAFRKLFEEKAGFDPMFNCITLSAACMAAFRRNFLPKETIGIVPQGGYHGRGKQSEIALKWLDYESHKLGKVIKTVLTDREVSVMGRKVDGYVELPHPDGTVEKRIYQFHGCFWHQCPTHFPPTEDDNDNRYENTVRLTALFRRNGFTVIEKWECEFNLELKTDPDTMAFFENHPSNRVTPLNLRDALMGGRTSALRWYHKADLDKGEKIKMVDVVSEYPNANLRAKYPVGHPEIFLAGDPKMTPVEEWNGAVKCTVVPPRDLYLPVLPYKANGRLMFPLCRTCVEMQNQEICTHADPKQRQLCSVWCAPEIHLAMEKGYKIETVHEVYQYPRTMKWNGETGREGLLSAYVRCFMALKAQASGWPADCTSDEAKQKYMDDVKKYDGITIDPAKVEKNPALRQLSKLMLNSFWGKFGEKTVRSKTDIVFDYAALIKIVSDPLKKVTGLIPRGDDCLQIVWQPIQETDRSLPTSSLIHAAFTTCHGRLQLYHYLDVVKERALYHDTDSICYISRPGEPELPLGTHLGDLTDQIEEDYGPGSFITEFVAGGPKNYAFKVAVGGDVKQIKVCIKVRGISINASCDQLVTFEQLKAMVMGEQKKTTVPIPRMIARLPTWQIVTRSGTKKWQAVNSKRRRVDAERTVPHGYNAWEMEDEEDQEILEALDLLMDV